MTAPGPTGRPFAILAAALLLSAVSCSAQGPGTGQVPEPARPLSFTDVTQQVGLSSARNDAYLDGVVSPDPVATMGTGLCWLDADRDGWMDLFVVNTWSVADLGSWRSRGGTPRSMLFRNVAGSFVDVSQGSGADISVRGTGCAAADLDRDGDTDLVVTAVGTTSVLWNDGDGTFTEGGRAAGLSPYGWYAGVAIGDVNGDGWQDVFLAGYADLNAPIDEPVGGFPRTYSGVRDLLFLSRGLDAGRVRFDEVGVAAGLESTGFRHGLGTMLTDIDADGDLDLYVANDLDPNDLYENVAWPGGAAADPAGLGFRFDEIGAPAGVADPNAGMGVAIGDLDMDGADDLIVTNARSQGDVIALRSPDAFAYRPLVDGAGPDSLEGATTGFGVSLADMDRDGFRDLLVVSGDVPVESPLGSDAEPLIFVRNAGVDPVTSVVLSDESAAVGLAAVGDLLARGSAVADFDNDGNLDVAIATVGGPVVLLRGMGGESGWVNIAPFPATPGTRVTVTSEGRASVCEIRAGGSYMSSEDPRCFFGLGEATADVRVEVVWPGGRRRVIEEVSPRQILRVMAW